MTLTIELKPEVEKLLGAVARERGVTLEEVINDRLKKELEDELSVADARRAYEEDVSGEHKTLIM